MDWLMKVFQNIEVLPGFSHELPSKPRAKVVPRKHNIFTHFPKDRVLLQSGLDGKWWADSMECDCYLRNIQDLLSDGRTV